MIARVFTFALAASLFVAPVLAQERRMVVVGTIGAVSLGHADSEQGKTPILGAAVGFHPTRRLLIEGGVHSGRVSQVFGRAHHDFSETTFTASLVFRSAPDGRAHFLAGGGAGLKRAHTDLDEPPLRIDRTETIRLLHGRMGVAWDISSRASIRTEGVLCSEEDSTGSSGGGQASRIGSETQWQTRSRGSSGPLICSLTAGDSMVLLGQEVAASSHQDRQPSTLTGDDT